MEPNETLIIRELIAGNEKAFRRLFDLYSPDIYAYSKSLLKSTSLAEENVQDVFLKVWLHREKINIEKSFKAWIFTIARNQAFTFLNKAVQDTALAEEIFYSTAIAAEETDSGLRTEEIKKLRKEAIRQLPPKRKQIFKMSRKKGMTYEEISIELGISVHTVRNQMSKALESMRLFFRYHDEFT